MKEKIKKTKDYSALKKRIENKINKLEEKKNKIDLTIAVKANSEGLIFFLQDNY